MMWSARIGRHPQALVASLSEPLQDQSIDGACTATPNKQGERHSKEGEVKFEAMPPPRLERHVEKEPIAPVDLSDGYKHHHYQSQRSGAGQDADKDREPAETLSQGSE